MIRATITALLLACASTGLPRTRPLALHMVADTGIFLTIQRWEQTPWWRPADSMQLEPPIHIILSTDGQACVVSAADWVMAVPNSLYGCQSGWRMPRP